MRSNWRNNIATSILLTLMLLVSACTRNDHAEHVDTYTCPMHPTVVSDKPGACPVCGMDLVKKARPGTEMAITEDLNNVLKSPHESVVSSIKTIRGEFKAASINIKAQGIVTYDTRSLFSIPSRVGGRLEKVLVKYPYQQIQKGQRIADIYSPEMLAAQRELLFLLENDPDNDALINGSKEKLKLLGTSESQINRLIHRKEPEATFTIFSPNEGYVIPTNQPAPKSPITGSVQGSGMNSGMTAAPNQSTLQSEELIREGSYVSPGQTLFKIVNAAALRVELNIPASSGSGLHKGDEVMLDFGNNDRQSSTIDLIQPFFSEGQEFLTIRLYTHHTDKLHIGHLVDAELKRAAIEALWIPADAVVDLGISKVVFVKEKDAFKPRKITVGLSADGLVEVRQGLSTVDEIAANAQYMIDSESFIKTQD